MGAPRLCHDPQTVTKSQVSGRRSQVASPKKKTSVIVGSNTTIFILLGMGSVKSFEEFEVWKTAREITCRIYSLTKRKAFAGDYGLRDQICRASVSMMSNIAEGYESQTESVFIRHLGIAKGSAGEVRSQLYVALDQDYITEAEFKTLTELSKKASRQMAKLLQYLKQCG